MKHLIAAALLIAPLHAHADIEFCTAYGDAAEMIMQNRQLNVPLHRMMQITMNHFGETRGEALFDMIREAYAEPAFRGEANRANSVSNFRNKHELECFEATKG